MIAARLGAEAVARFPHVEAVDVLRARFVVVPVLTPGVAGMTIGRWVLLRRGHAHDVGVVAHELVHVEQWRTPGPIRFLRAYLGAYARGRRDGLGHAAAYRAIPFEAEARDRTGT